MIPTTYVPRRPVMKYGYYTGRLELPWITQGSVRQRNPNQDGTCNNLLLNEIGTCPCYLDHI